MKFQTFNDRNKMYVHLNDNTECALKAMPKLKIGCGKYCGLPFDCLMTDVISGCLSKKESVMEIVLLHNFGKNKDMILEKEC